MGVNSRKEKERDIRRNEIIDAAEKIFSLNGFGNSTMDDIAKESEFSKRTIYVYFKSKEQLYSEIMLRGFKLLNYMSEKKLIESSPNTGIQKIKTLGGVIVEFNFSHPLYFKVIMEYENGDMDFDASNMDTSIEDCYMEGEKLIKFFMDAVDEGIKEGSIRSDVDVVSTALMLWASIFGVLNIMRKKEKYLEIYHHKTASELIDEAFKFMIRAIEK